MLRTIARLMAAGALVALLAGCGGTGLLTLLGLIQVGDVIGDVEDLIGGDEPTQFDVYLDGQLLPVTPNASGDLRLNNLPEGRHLLQVIAPSRERGAVTIVNINPNSELRLDNLVSVVGGRIRGKVQLEDVGGALRPARRVPVYAIPGGANLVAAGAVLVIVPPTSTHYIAFTNDLGEYSLDAIAPGDYLVTTAVAGRETDVQLVEGLVERQTLRNLDLTLVADDGDGGTVSGNVEGQLSGGGTQTLGGASLRATPGTPFRPAVDQDAIDRVAAASGATLRQSPWFEWRVLSTLADSGGSYLLALPPGAARVACFAYFYRPGYLDTTVTAGVDRRLEFALQRN